MRVVAMTAGLLLWMVASGCSEPSDGSVAHAGEETYLRYCFSCHAAGVAGAPKLGVPEDWTARIAKGRAALLQTTIDGIPPGMPARGLCMECSDEALNEAIDYMIRDL